MTNLPTTSLTPADFEVYSGDGTSINVNTPVTITGTADDGPAGDGGELMAVSLSSAITANWLKNRGQRGQ